MEPMKTYLTAVERNLKAGNATEHTHRPALKELIESLAENITATNEPKREKCGAVKAANKQLKKSNGSASHDE
jgi:hypothetical protein